MPRHGNGFIHGAHVAEPWQKPEHEDAIACPRVPRHDLVGADAGKRRDGMQVRPHVAAVLHGDDDGLALGEHRRRIGRACQGVANGFNVHGERIEVDGNAAVRGHDVTNARQAGAADSPRNRDHLSIDRDVDDLFQFQQ